IGSDLKVRTTSGGPLQMEGGTPRVEAYGHGPGGSEHDRTLSRSRFNLAASRDRRARDRALQAGNAPRCAARLRRGRRRARLGRATLLHTDQPDMNQIVQEQEIKALPLNGRDFFSLLLLSNGVQDTSNDTGGATTNVTFSINGMRPESNSVTLDGVQMASVRE